jgi:hypothetical protein
VAAVLASRALAARQWRALWWAAGAGAGCGLGYFIRAETLVVIPLGVILLLVEQVRQKASWKIFLASAAMIAVAALACSAPYILATGRIAGRIPVPGLSATSAFSPLAAALYNVDDPAPIRLIGRYFEAQHPVGASLVVLWLVLAILAGISKKETLKKNLVMISSPGAILIITIWVLAAPVLAYHYAITGALSHRYLVLPASMMAGLSGAALISACRLCPGRAGALLPAIVSSGIVIALLVHACGGLHDKDIHHRKAGEWIAARAGQGDAILTDSSRVGHYSGLMSDSVTMLGGWRINLQKQKGHTIQAIYASALHRAGQECRFAAVMKAFVDEDPEAVNRVFSNRGFRKVKSFGEKEVILIFEK